MFEHHILRDVGQCLVKFNVISICSEVVVKQYLSKNMQSLSLNRLNFNIYSYDVATLGGGPNSGSLSRLFWQIGCLGVPADSVR